MRGGKKYFKISRSGYDELCYEARHIAPNDWVYEKVCLDEPSNYYQTL